MTHVRACALLACPPSRHKTHDNLAPRPTPPCPSRQGKLSHDAMLLLHRYTIKPSRRGTGNGKSLEQYPYTQSSTPSLTRSDVGLMHLFTSSPTPSTAQDDASSGLPSTKLRVAKLQDGTRRSQHPCTGNVPVAVSSPSLKAPSPITRGPFHRPFQQSTRRIRR